RLRFASTLKCARSSLNNTSAREESSKRTATRWSAWLRFCSNTNLLMACRSDASLQDCRSKIPRLLLRPAAAKNRRQLKNRAPGRSNQFCRQSPAELRRRRKQARGKSATEKARVFALAFVLRDSELDHFGCNLNSFAEIDFPE